jgi:hypothetical protein
MSGSFPMAQSFTWSALSTLIQVTSAAASAADCLSDTWISGSAPMARIWSTWASSSLSLKGLTFCSLPPMRTSLTPLSPTTVQIEAGSASHQSFWPIKVRLMGVPAGYGIGGAIPSATVPTGSAAGGAVPGSVPQAARVTNTEAIESWSRIPRPMPRGSSR